MSVQIVCVVDVVADNRLSRRGLDEVAEPTAPERDVPHDEHLLPAASTIGEPEDQRVHHRTPSELNEDFTPTTAPEPRETLPGLYPESLSTYVGHGLWMGTMDRQFVLRASGFIHLDGRLAYDRHNEDWESNVFFRRVRLTVDGRMPGNLEYRFMWDQMIDPLIPYDFHLDWRPMAEFNIRVGAFKSPFGLERRARSYALPFIERGMPTALAPNRELGIFFYGQTRDGFFSYEAAMVNGAENLGLRVTEFDSPDFAGRVYFLPFRLAPELKALRNFGVGFSWTVGKQVGSEVDPYLGAIRATPRRSVYGGRRLFQYLDDELGRTIAYGIRDRQSLHIHWHHKQFYALFEYVRSAQRVARGFEQEGSNPIHQAYLAHHAWQAAIGYTLNADDKNTFFGVKPKSPVDFLKGQWGGATVSLRYHELYMDPASFPVFASSGWARAVRAVTSSFQWHINLQFKLQFDLEYQFVRTADPSVGRLPSELSAMSRLEVRY